MKKLKNEKINGEVYTFVRVGKAVLAKRRGRTVAKASTKEKAMKRIPKSKKIKSKREMIYEYEKLSSTPGKKYSKKADSQRRAMSPGKRRSASGKIYYERRRNRADTEKWL